MPSEYQLVIDMQTKIRNWQLATDTILYEVLSDGVRPSVEYVRYKHLNSVLNSVSVSGISLSGGSNLNIVNTAFFKETQRGTNELVLVNGPSYLGRAIIGHTGTLFRIMWGFVQIIA